MANRIPGSVDLFDAGSGERLANVRVGDGTLDLALPPGVGKIYASDESSGTISVLDTSSMERVAVISTGDGSKPHHMDANSDGTLVYVSLFGTNKIAAVDTADDTLDELGFAPVPQTPDTMSLSPDGHTLLVGLRGSPATCASVDLETLTTTALALSDKAGTSTGHHDLSADGKWGFIAVDGAGAPPQIAVLDMEKQSVHDRWDDAGRPHGIIFEPSPEQLKGAKWVTR